MSTKIEPRTGNTWLAICLAITMIFASFSTYPGQAAPSQSTQNEITETIITVDSGSDIDTSLSKTCVSDTPCTLRRAIVQARNVPLANRPVRIQFNIPATAAEGYISALQIWKINVLTTSDPSVFRRLNGQIIIDGSTQPGGRTNGPKIILFGPGTGQKDGFIVGDVGGNNGHEIRGLGFQNFKTHIYLNTIGNLIENNWFGLSDDGLGAYIRGGNLQDGSGNTGIAFASEADNNIVRNNHFLGLAGVAAAVRGEGNEFSDNIIGLNRNGLAPDKETSPSLVCTPVDWLGGGGISVTDTGNIIQDNVLAGLRLQVSIWSLQTDTIRVSGQEHTIQNNRIGYDTANHEIGVCGRGIYLSDSPQTLMVVDNKIVEPGLSAISANGVLYNENTLRSNTVKKTTPWPEIEGNPNPEDAIQMGTSLPDPLELFIPAEVTSIDGTAVIGTQGLNSPCPNCIIEIFLDDNDAIVELLESLGTTTADADGRWNFTLPSELLSGQGLRTTSTTAAYNTIPNIYAGTTTRVSALYEANVSVYLPLLRKR